MLYIWRVLKNGNNKTKTKHIKPQTNKRRQASAVDLINKRFSRNDEAQTNHN